MSIDTVDLVVTMHLVYSIRHCYLHLFFSVTCLYNNNNKMWQLAYIIIKIYINTTNWYNIFTIVEVLLLYMSK